MGRIDRSNQELHTHLLVPLGLPIRLASIGRLVLYSRRHGRFHEPMQVGIICPALGVCSSHGNMLIYIYIHTHRQRQYNIYTALLKQGRMFEESWGYFFGGGGGINMGDNHFPLLGGLSGPFVWVIVGSYSTRMMFYSY